VALGSTRHLTEVSTRDLPVIKWRPALKADNSTAICEMIVYKIWEHRRPTTLHGLFQEKLYCTSSFHVVQPGPGADMTFRLYWRLFLLFKAPDPESGMLVISVRASIHSHAFVLSFTCMINIVSN
jgi:hypothetical protein